MKFQTTRISLTLLVLTGIFTLAASAFAQTSESVPDLVLSEVQLGTVDSASEEFVELANRSVEPIELSGIRLEYLSKTGSSWSTKAELDGMIAPYGRVLLSNYLEQSSDSFSGGLANGGGHLRIISQTGQVLDTLGWGEGAVQPEGVSIPAHGPNQSLKRLVNEDGQLIDTDNNLTDWFISDNPSPHFDEWQMEAETEPLEESQTDNDPPADDQSTPTVSPETVISSQPLPAAATHQLELSEVFPDPASPFTDAEHEFVELYNPNSFAVELRGYILESGTNWRYSYQIGEYTLGQGEYFAIFSQDSNLTLSNSGSAVRLIGPDGTVLDQVEYPKAKSGQSWSKYADGWAWSQPSNNQANPVAPVAETTNSQSSQNQAATSNSEGEETQVLGVRNVDFPATDKSSSAVAEAESGNGFVDDQAASETPLNNWVLAGVGLMAVLYAVYEYRRDIYLRVQQLRRYLTIRRQGRPES